MNERRRRENLDALRREISRIEDHTADVLAAMDATLDDLTTTLEDPANRLSDGALASEIATVRAELLAARAARDAVRAQLRKVAGPMMEKRSFETMMRHRHELMAHSAEGERQAERIAMLQLALRELGAETD